MRVRLAVIVSHPIQYHSVLWKALAADESLDVKVFFGSDKGVRQYYDREFGIHMQWDRPLLGGYSYEFLSETKDFEGIVGQLTAFNPAAATRLLASKFDAVYIHGVSLPAHVMALITAKLIGVPVIVRAIGYNVGARSLSRRLVRQLYYGVQYRMADVCLYAGKLNYEYFRSFGVKHDTLIFAPHVVDNACFESTCRRWKSESDRARKTLGVRDGEHVVLFCGKLIPKKQPELLLQAFLDARVPKNWVLLYVGEGPLRPRLEGLVRHIGSRRVRFAGFLNQREIAQAYSLAEILVLPSSGETWGLVINEGMNCGCAVIASDRVGCYPDLVRGAAGLVFRYDDAKGLTRCLERLILDGEFRGRCQARAREKIGTWGPEQFVMGVKQAVSKVIAR